MNTIKHIANILFRVILLASFILQSNVIPVRAETSVNLVEGLAFWANRKYCDWDHLCSSLSQDYFDNGVKHLGYFSVSGGEGVDIGTTVYFDLDDYMGITPEGNAGWITVWTDLNIDVGISSLPVGAGSGIVRIQRKPGYDDPLNSFEIVWFEGSYLVWKFTSLSISPDGFMFKESSTMESFSMGEAKVAELSVNIHRAEYKKSYIDRLGIEALMLAGSGILAPSLIASEFINKLFKLDNNGLLASNILPYPEENRNFSTLDNGKNRVLDGGIVHARGGLDTDGDHLPDNFFPNSSSYGNLNVGFDTWSTDQEDYHVKMVGKPTGWVVWANDTDAPPFLGQDTVYDVPDVPAQWYGETQWAVQCSLNNNKGFIVFELWVKYWEELILKYKYLDTKYVPVSCLSGTGNAPAISTSPMPTKNAGQPVTIGATITDADGIDGTWLFYVHIPGAWTRVDMQHTGGNQYQATIPGSAVAEPEIIYYISAFDGTAISYTQNMAFVVSAPPTIKTVTASPNKSQYTPGETVTINVSLRDGSGNLLTGATLTHSVDNRAPNNSFTEIGNGSYTIQFAAPSSVKDYPVTVTASKSGYATGQGATTITVYQSVDPGHNLKANYISVDAGTHLPNQSVRIVGNIVNLGSYNEQARLVFRLKDPNGVVIGTSNGATFSLQAGYQSQNYSADLIIGSSTGEYQAEVTAEIIGYSDFDPSDNKLKAPVYVGTTPTFNEFGLVQMAVVEGQTSGVVQNHKIKVLSASGSSAAIDVLRSDGSTVTDCYHKTVNTDVIMLCDSDRFAVILDVVASSVPHEAWFYVGQGGNIDNTDIAFSPETATTPAGTTASYHVTANSTRRLVNFDITIRGIGDDFNTVSAWDFGSHRHGNYYDWDLELDVPGDATVKKYMYWVRFDDSNDVTYDRFIRRLWVDVKQSHNIQVNSVTPSSSSITEGNTVQIQANLSNLSGYTEYNLEAICKITGPNGYSQIMTQSISSLGPNATQNLTWNWSTGGLPAGTYTIQVNVPLSIDALPNNNTLSVSNNVVTPPQLVVNPSTDKLSYYQAENVQVSASVISNGNPVTDASVAYFLKNSSNNVVLSGNLIHTSGGIYNATVSAPLQTGIYRFTVSATKNGAISSSLDTGNITINTAPPLVYITSTTPYDGELINYHDITFNWAGSAIGVSSDQLQYSYRLDSQAWSAYSSQTSLTLTGVSEGIHNIDVKVRIISGMENPIPASRTFTIDTQPPVIQASPTINASSYIDGNTVIIQVDLDIAASVSASFNNLDSQYSPSLVAVTESNPASHIYTITYTINPNNTFPDNSYPITIYAVDNAGNTTIDSTLQIRLDNSNPIVNGKDPDSGATDIELDSSIIVYFSEPMEKSSVQSAFSITPSISGNMTWAGNSLIFDPGANLACETVYTAQLSSSATDLIGKLLSPASWSFTTRSCNFPEINVKGNNVSIADGDYIPSITDHTDFGSASVTGGAVSHTFTIYNTGNANLILSGTPKVAVGGANASDFTVNPYPASPIAGPSGSTTFTIIFDPSAAGSRTATISIANNDSDENPYNFSIQGTGTATSPEIDLRFNDNGVSIADGDTVPSTGDGTDFGNADVNAGSVSHWFRIWNTGTANLNLRGNPRVIINGANASDFTVNTQPGSSWIGSGSNSVQFEVLFNPSGVGLRTATVSIANDDANEDPYNFSLQGAGTTTCPNNNDFNCATNIDSLPYTITQTDIGLATTASDDPFFACVSGKKYNSVWYRVTPSVGGRIGVNTFGSDYDTVLAVWTGLRGSLVSTACNDDASSFQSEVKVDVLAGTTYYIEVASYSSITSGSLTLNVLSGNVEVSIGGSLKGSYLLTPGSSARDSYASVNNGPVRVVNTNTFPIINSLRVLYGGVSYSEMIGFPANQLTTDYWFPYYNNVAMNSQLRVSNVGGSSTTVTVTYGNNIPLDNYTLAAGATIRKNYAGINSGPLHVNSSSSNILTTIRVLYGGLSYSELMGFPNNQLAKDYWYPYYNNTAMNSQLRVSNVGSSSTTITVTYGNNIPLDSYTLAAGAATRKNYAGINSGPLHVTSSDSNILTTIRVLYADQSYSELSGFPANQLTKEYVYPVYDNVTANSQLRVSNVGGTPTLITVYGANNAVIDSYTLAAGAATRKNYAGVNNGPLRVVSSVSNILTTQRLLYTTPGFDSFYELTGFPVNQLTTEYYFPWYNNVAMNSQLRIAVP